MLAHINSLIKSDKVSCYVNTYRKPFRASMVYPPNLRAIGCFLNPFERVMTVCNAALGVMVFCVDMVLSFKISFRRRFFMLTLYRFEARATR